MRIFFASDFHGATGVWRAAAQTIASLDPDIAFLGGDLLGKYPVVTMEVKGGRHLIVEYDNPRRYGPKGIRKEIRRFVQHAELSYERLQCEKKGFYWIEVSEGAFEDWNKSKKSEGFQEDDAILTEDLWRRYIEAAKERLSSWLRTMLAAVASRQTMLIVMTGNDDAIEVDDTVRQFSKEGVVFPIDRLISVNGFEIISIAHATPTPWNTPREAEENELAMIIEEKARELSSTTSAIFNFHCPPFGTPLDEVRLAQRTLHVGSRAILESIKKYQPILSLHGHVHEAQGVLRIGRTTAINPGSGYADGILQAYVIEVADTVTAVPIRKTAVEVD